MRMKPPSEDILTEWPMWPFTRLTPSQVAYFDFMEANKNKKPKYDSSIEQAPF